MEHGKFVEAINATISLFSKYLAAQATRLESLPRAQAPTIPMSMAVTNMEMLNARGIFEQLEIMALRFDGTDEHSAEDETNLAEWLAEFEDAFAIQRNNVSIMAEMAPNPAHTKGGEAVAELQELLGVIKSIDGIEGILAPASRSWHTQRNRDGALYVQTFCQAFKATRGEFDAAAKEKISDILRKRREFKAALTDPDNSFSVTDLTSIHEKTLGNEQDCLYPNPDAEGGRFTPVFDLIEARLAGAENPAPLLEAWRTLSIPTPALDRGERKEEEMVTAPEDPDAHDRVVDSTSDAEEAENPRVKIADKPTV